MPVDSLASGMSIWGAHHLAGNVAELLRNRFEDGFAATGGGFDDPAYQFGTVASYPGFFTSPKLGFRCVRTRGTGDEGASALAAPARKAQLPQPAGDAEYARLRSTYDYEHTPLNARVIERTETADWVREKVSFTGARGKTALAYLYLPKGVRPPHQVVHFIPAGDVWAARNALPTSMENAMSPLLRGGRALFGVVLEGFRERHRDPADPEPELADHIVDLRRGLDYLTSRPDVAANKIAFCGHSAGDPAYVLTAVDDRHAAAVFVGSYLGPADVSFIPRLHGSKLVVHGKYDEVNRFPLHAQPLFDLMRGEKELLAFEGGHIPPNDWMIPRLVAFYDKVLGPAGS
jgi:hypothetical protein